MLINARDPTVISDEKQFLTGNEFGQFEYSCILHRKQIQNKTQQKNKKKKTTTNKQNEKKIKTKKKYQKYIQQKTYNVTSLVVEKIPMTRHVSF